MKNKAILIILVFSLFVTFCLDAEAKTELKVVSWWDFTNSESLQKLKEKFEEMNPDIELNFMQIGSGYADKVLVMIAGGADLPDVMMLAMDKVPTFASKDAILNLDQFINKDEEFKQELNNLYPVIENALTFNNSFYAMPRDVTSKVMFINKEMFAEAGVSIPDADWTWEDFSEKVKALTKDKDGDGKTDQWGFYFPKYMDGFTHWMMQNGGGLVTMDGKCLLGRPESKEALNFLRDLILDGYIPSETQAEQFGQGWSAPFVAGKVAMVEGGLSTTVSLKDTDIDYVIRPLPKGKKRMSTAFVNAWTIPKGVENPELSWKVLKFFASKEAQQIVLNTGMGLPANKQVDITEFLEERQDHSYIIESLEYSEPFPTPLNGADFYKLVQNEFDLMWLGEESIEEAVQDVEEKADRVLSGER